MRRDAVEADRGERADRSRHCDRTDHVRTARLFPVGKVGPDDGVGRDGVHRAASSVVGNWSECRPVPDQGTSAVRGVHLVSRHGDEVEMAGIVVGAHVDRPVRRELGGVDEDPATGRVDLLGQLVHRLHDAGDVRCA